MFSHLVTPARQILTGNLLMIGCCIFYIAWWLVAFHPTHAIKGFKSGWLLIPAFILGVAAAVQLIRGAVGSTPQTQLMPRLAILIGGVVVYGILLALTYLLLKRQITSELVLLVGWTVLMFLGVNALYASGIYSISAAVVFLVISVVAAGIGIVCYLLYYDLDNVKGYIDGLIPLVLCGAVMAGITISAAVSGSQA
ncbi:MAG: hypothetical protein LUC17_01730 [Oscillospiraceae bacterium]|nr:hypothetical protein [Oscillospiraceae bacterium]